MDHPLCDGAEPTSYGATTNGNPTHHQQATASPFRHLRWASSPFRNHHRASAAGEIQLSSEDDEGGRSTPSSLGTPSMGTPSTLATPSSSTQLQHSTSPPPPPPPPPAMTPLIRRSSFSGSIRSRSSINSRILVPKRNKVLVLVASCLGIYSMILFVLWNKSIVHHYGGGNGSSSDSSSSSSFSSDYEASSDYKSYASASSRSTSRHHSSAKSSYYYSSKSLFPRMQQFLFDHFLPWGTLKDKTTSLQPPAHQTRSILLVLHAEASPESPYIEDPKRPLTAKGIRDAEELGEYLKENNIQQPDWIFASPSIRTSYTLELMRRHWASDVPVAFEDILYILAFNDYFAFCAGLNFNFHRVMIVGHNPAILNTAKKLMAHHGIEDFPEAGLMELRWTAQAEWRTLTPFTGETEMAVSPDELDQYFNVTVTKLSRRRHRLEQQQLH